MTGRRRKRRAGPPFLLAGLSALTFLSSGCGDRADETSVRSPSVAERTASSTTAAAPRSARFRFEHARIGIGTGASTSVEDVETVAVGAVDVVRGLVELRSSLTPAIQLDDVGYTDTVPTFVAETHLLYDLAARQAFVEQGGAWVSTPFPEDGSGHFPGADLYDPTRVLAYLRGFATAETEVARATVDGVPATRWQLVLRPDAILGEGWVALVWTADAGGTVLQLELTNGGEQLTLHFTGFDEPVSIDRPDTG